MSEYLGCIKKERHDAARFNVFSCVGFMTQMRADFFCGMRV